MPEQGTVNWFSAAKGYGFIRRETTDEDVFVHYSAIAGAEGQVLADGERVSFEIVESPRGLQARQVKRLSELG